VNLLSFVSSEIGPASIVEAGPVTALRTT